MKKVISWDDKEWKKNLQSRLKDAKSYREFFEDDWENNARIMYNLTDEGNQVLLNPDGSDHYTLDNSEEKSTYGANYVFKYIRFIHSQVSANPPSVIIRPNSTERQDKHAADAADRITRYVYKKYAIQEKIDQTTLKTLTRGSGFIKIFWDVDGGELLSFDKKTGEVLTTGDIKIYSPSIWDIWIDSSAKTWDEVRFVFERIQMPLEEAKFMYPNHAKKFDETIAGNKVKELMGVDNKVKVVDVFVYYEKGMPSNGFAGRYAVHTEDGELLDAPKYNPHPDAKLPYHILTDVDVEDFVFGKSNIEYVAKIQDLINRFDSAAVEAIEAHGVVRMLVPKDCEVSDDVITNSSYDVISYEGQIPPTFMQPMSLPPDMPRTREMLKVDCQEIIGVNDAMLGNQKREQSGFSLQTAIEAGNMTRRRLYNKYAMFIEGIYRDIIALVSKHWTEKHKVMVIGKEKAFETKYFSNADLEGGFDLVVEYGASLPLEPSMRRESIMLLQPLLKEAGVDASAVLSMLKLNDIESMYDLPEMASDKQQRIFDRMLEYDIYIAPEELEDHEKMLTYCNKYLMRAEFENLLSDKQALIIRHVKERMEFGKQALAGGALPAEGQPAPQGMPPMPQGVPPAV
jgi:hypothetical protein